MTRPRGPGRAFLNPSNRGLSDTPLKERFRHSFGRLPLGAEGGIFLVITQVSERSDANDACFWLFCCLRSAPLYDARVQLNSTPISKYPIFGGFLTRLLAPKHG